MNQIKTIGIASSLGGNHQESEFGPLVLQDSDYFNRHCYNNGIEINWQSPLMPDLSLPQFEAVKKLCQQAADRAEALTKSNQPFIFFTGEHTYAMGIWRGVMTALDRTEPIHINNSNKSAPKKLGLIWIDAHMDAHTFISSPSGNIHGMPVAALLGHGDERLAEIYGNTHHLEPESIALLGLRNFERNEQALLSTLNVKQVFMNDMTTKSISKSLLDARNHVLKHADCYGISLDIDAVDPADAPAVGVPEPDGIYVKA